MVGGRKGNLILDELLGSALEVTSSWKRIDQLPVGSKCRVNEEVGNLLLISSRWSSHWSDCVIHIIWNAYSAIGIGAVELGQQRKHGLPLVSIIGSPSWGLVVHSRVVGLLSEHVDLSCATEGKAEISSGGKIN
jgi:hypothetical protein